MGLFGRRKQNAAPQVQPSPQPASNAQAGAASPVSSAGILNLKKGDVLDLTKYSASLSKVHAAAGWDVVAFGKDYDLDLCAYLFNSNDHLEHIVYYGDKRYNGIYLDQDNLTGEGEGDDENIHVDLNRLPSSVSKIVFAVVIFHAAGRHQKFGKVQNAYVRLCDEANGDREICRYQLTENGGENTAVTVAELNKTAGGTWEFRAIGNYSKNSIESLSRTL